MMRQGAGVGGSGGGAPLYQLMSMSPSVVQKIYKIRMITIPALEKGGIFPNFQVICQGHIFYNYRKSEKIENKLVRGQSYIDFFIRKKNLLVFEDVRVQFYSNKKPAFHFWFNTRFID